MRFLKDYCTHDINIVHPKRLDFAEVVLYRGYMFGRDKKGLWFSKGLCDTVPGKSIFVEIFRERFVRSRNAVLFLPCWETITAGSTAAKVRDYMIAHPEKPIAKSHARVPVETRGMRMTREYLIQPHGRKTAYADWMKQG